MEFNFTAEFRMGANTFQSLLKPALFCGVHDVHIFGTDGTAIGHIQRCKNIIQRGFILTNKQRAGLENSIQIGPG